MIAKFVEIGVLRDKDRNDAAAVERALAVIRQRTFEVLAGCIDE
jgi:acetolactate synthase regulatory subunit